MRRTFATLLITALLASSAPSFARREDSPFGPLTFIKKIVRLLIPSPTDDGGVITPPKP